MCQAYQERCLCARLPYSNGETRTPEANCISTVLEKTKKISGEIEKERERRREGYLGRLWTVVWKKYQTKIFSIGEVRPHPHLSQIPRKRELRGRVRMMSKNGKAAVNRTKRSRKYGCAPEEENKSLFSNFFLALFSKIFRGHPHPDLDLPIQVMF